MKIAILLPYKENFSPEYPGAVSLFVHETSKISRYKNNIIVFTDLDGSLLNTQNFKFEKAKSLIKKIIKDSNFIIPNSSKTELEIKNFIKKLKIKLPFISENGSEIHNLNTIERKLPKKITIARDRNTILKIFLKVSISLDLLFLIIFSKSKPFSLK